MIVENTNLFTSKAKEKSNFQLCFFVRGYLNLPVGQPCYSYICKKLMKFFFARLGTKKTTFSLYNPLTFKGRR